MDRANPFGSEEDVNLDATIKQMGFLETICRDSLGRICDAWMGLEVSGYHLRTEAKAMLLLMEEVTKACLN